MSGNKDLAAAIAARKKQQPTAPVVEPSAKTKKWQHNRKLDISVFESTRDLGDIEHQADTWDGLCTYLAERPPSASRKDRLQLFKFAKFGETRNPNGAHSLRWNGNVRHLSGIVAEHDAGEVSVDEAAKRLDAAGVAAFIYTTPSHMQDGKGPRWRVLTPLAEDAAPDEHSKLVDKLNGALGGVLAPESWVLTQPMYFGKVDGTLYETRRVKGVPLDLVEGITPIGKKGQLAEQRVERTRDELAPTAHLTELRRLVYAKNADGDYDTWLKVGQAIHHETQGGDDGLALWDEWSAQSGKYPGLDQLAYKWSSFGNAPNPVTAGWLRQGIVATAADLPPPLTDDELDLLGDAQRVSFAFVALREFAKREPVRYLVEGLIEIGQLFGFIGKRKGGKSYVALDLAFAVAQGRPFAHHAVLESGPVMWIAAEGARSLQVRRSPQWLAHYGDADIRVWPHALNMRKPETFQGLVEACAGARLVVIDSLRRVTPGAKENSSDELAEVLAYAEQLALTTGAAVCFIAHAGKTKAEGEDMTARGTSAIEDSLEAGFFVEKLEGDDAGKFRVTPGFARDEETGAEGAMHFKLDPIAPEGLDPGVIVNWDVDAPLPKEKKRKTPDYLAITDEVIAQLAPKFTRKEARAAAKALADERFSGFSASALEKGVDRALDVRMNGTERTIKATTTEKRGKTESATEFEVLPVSGNPDHERVARELAETPPAADPNIDLL